MLRLHRHARTGGAPDVSNRQQTHTKRQQHTRTYITQHNIYIYIYTHTYTYTYIHIHTYIYIYMYMYLLFKVVL